MNRSYSKIRHIQESNMALEQRRFNQLLESRMGDVKPLITEDANAEAQVKKIESQYKSGQIKADEGIMERIIKCVEQEGLTHLAILTSGAGAYALGLIAACIGSGVGAPLGLAMAGMVLIILEGIGIEGEGVADEVDRLMTCMGV